jgi:outer membrane protein OmpA-like peptidoglycan-associated protein
MSTPRVFSLSLLTLAVLAGCNTLPANNAALDKARSDVKLAQDNAQTRELAPDELRRASDALVKANQSFARSDEREQVDHWAYMAGQRAAIAQEVTRQKVAEQAVAGADAQRDKLRLAARTSEADTAQRNAQSAQREADVSKQQADASKQQADAALQQAADAQARSGQLEAQMKDMNAKKTDRGMVVTVGDVLFDTNQSQLKPGGLRNMDKVVGFLKQYPMRKVLIEGFTDSSGSDSLNQQLSDRRADAVRSALVDSGVSGERIRTQGLGEAYPVASNDSAGGRQMNRRVEIVLSDDSGLIAPR